LRSTALPTFLATVKPNRAGPASWRGCVWSTNADAEALVPRAAARKSARCFSRSIKAAPAARSGTQPLAAACASRGDHPAAALGCHAGAKAMPTLAHQPAGLIGPLHEWISGLRGMPDTGFGAEPRPCARDRSPGGPAAQSPAAYTGPRSAKSMRGCDATEKTRVAFTGAGSAASSSSNAGERSSASDGFMYMSGLHVVFRP